MKLRTDLKKNFLRSYLDPELLSKTEAEKDLQERGVNIEQLQKKGKEFVKELEANLARRKVASTTKRGETAKHELDTGKERHEKFLNIVEQFKKEKPATELKAGKYRMAARKQNGVDVNGVHDAIDDAKLLEFMKKKKGDWK